MLDAAANNPLMWLADFHAQLHPRLLQFIRIDGILHPVLRTPCWWWTGRFNRNGYGRIGWQGKEPVAHRVIFCEAFGQDAIPPRHLLDHLCTCRSCVNPLHMDPVTVKINTLRGNAVLYRPHKEYINADS